MESMSLWVFGIPRINRPIFAIFSITKTFGEDKI